MRKDARIDPSGIVPLVSHYGEALSFYGTGIPEFVYRYGPGESEDTREEELLARAEELIGSMEKYLTGAMDHPSKNEKEASVR